MNYIVLDMEWNQPWPGSPSAKKVLPVQIRGEIIQIGAVRITEDQQVGDGSASSPASRKPSSGTKASQWWRRWTDSAVGAARM